MGSPVIWKEHRFEPVRVAPVPPSPVAFFGFSNLGLSGLAGRRCQRVRPSLFGGREDQQQKSGACGHQAGEVCHSCVPCGVTIARRPARLSGVMDLPFEQSQRRDNSTTVQQQASCLVLD